ncbi:MAG: hypothetical protein NTW86_27875, partial [Candidatus Sumerlaeota bacterium]|nr:hypothetical protein [Candidatus Sumerlaeota bacterium]
RYDEALKKFEEAKALAPDDSSLLLDAHISRARLALEAEGSREVAQAAAASNSAGSASASSAPMSAMSAAPPIPEAEKANRLNQLYEEGFSLYEGGDLKGARAKMDEALLIDPTFEKAKTFLDSTNEEWARQTKDQAVVAAVASREAAGEAKLKELVTIETKNPVPLGDFMASLSLATGINFALADGTDIKVTGKFTDEPLENILNTVLTPMGLKWTREKGDIITVKADLQPRTFQLSGDSVGNVRVLLESKQLANLLWPPDGMPKLKGQELTLDDRANLLVATDSKQNLEKLASLLDNLKAVGPSELITRMYEVPEDKAQKTKTLLETVLNAEGPAPYDLERKILADGGTLIVRAIPDDIQKIEDLLQSENLIGKIYSRDLKLQTFNLIPKESLRANEELMRAFFERVVEQIETFLYARDGRMKAAAEGRKLWKDENSYQITITDYPENLAHVGDFVNSLEQLERQMLFKVIYLKYALSDTMRDNLVQFFGLAAAQAAGAPTGPQYQVTRTLRVDSDYTFNQNLTVRVRRVNENNAADPNDDSVELIVRTPTRSESITLRKYESQFIDDYEIVAEDIRPSGVPGEGRADLQFRFIPPPGQAGAAAAPVGAPGAAPAITAA